MEKGGLSAFVIDEAWFEQVHPGSVGSSLLVAVNCQGELYEHPALSGENVEAVLSGEDGQPIGVVTLRFIGCLKSRAVFEAIGLRPAGDQSRPEARPSSALLMRSLVMP